MMLATLASVSRQAMLLFTANSGNTRAATASSVFQGLGAEHPYRRVGPTQAVSVLSISCRIRSCSVMHSGISVSAMIVMESGGQRARPLLCAGAAGESSPPAAPAQSRWSQPSARVCRVTTRSIRSLFIFIKIF